MVNPEQLADITRLFDRLKASGSDIDEGYQAQFETDSCGQSAELRKIRRLFWNEPGFWQGVLESAGVFDFARNIVPGKPSLILHAGFLKPAKVGSPVTPHQDAAFWIHPYPGALTVWIAIDEASPENGCLKIFPGSHKMGLLPHVAHPNSPWHETVPDDSHGIEPEYAPAAPGDAVCWHRLMLHSSDANLSGRNRYGMVLVFADASIEGFHSIDRYLI
ncbi:MAG: phytanoyl-CoA dioxygenase family protein [Rhodobacteraceae bacterium]|nr:phytanoyl-CoA dioxygenase family protein [Paracoccaceae bacterium]